MLRKFSFKDIFIAVVLAILSIAFFSCSEGNPVQPLDDNFNTAEAVSSDTSNVQSFDINKEMADPPENIEIGEDPP